MDNFEVLLVVTIIYVVGTCVTLFKSGTNKNKVMGRLFILTALNVTFIYAIEVQTLPIYIENRFIFILCLGLVSAIFYFAKRIKYNEIKIKRSKKI